MIDEKVREIIEANKGFVVIMAGSDSDEPHIEKIAESLEKFEIPYEVRICSAHKQADALMELIQEYNKINGLIGYAAIAGGTDALSGTSSFHALGPVVSCPPDTRFADKDKYQNNFNESCLTNPPGSPNAYIARPENVGKFFAQMFAGVNERCRELLIEKNKGKIGTLEKEGERIHDKYNKKQGR